MKLNKLQQDLERCDQGDLIFIINSVIDKFPETEAFIRTSYFGSAEDMRSELEKAKLSLFKTMIHPATKSKPAKFKLRMKLAQSKLVINQFKLLSPAPALVYELMMTYCLRLNTHLQMMADAKYYAGNAKLDRRMLSMLRMLRDARAYAQKHSIPGRITSELESELEDAMRSHERINRYLNAAWYEVFDSPRDKLS